MAWRGEARQGPSMREEALRELYRELARLLGYELRYHTRDSRRSDRGFPDDVLLRPRDGRLLIVEAKSAAGTLSREQRAWIGALNHRTVEAHVWRPADWLDGTIERILREEAKS